MKIPAGGNSEGLLQSALRIYTLREVFEMSAMISSLLVLFKIDRNIHSFQTSLDNVQRDEKRQQAKIAELTRQFDSVDNAIKKTQAEVNLREVELKGRQEKIEKMRSSLNTTKTNKEYSAILIQISAEKAEVAKIEGGSLELMQQVENNQKIAATLKSQLENERATLAKIEAGQAEKVGALKGQIDALMFRRNEAAKTVPAESLLQYERVSKKYPGDAMAALEYNEHDLEETSCGSCYMTLNVEHLNALRGRDEIRKCNSCGRILYLAELMPKE